MKMIVQINVISRNSRDARY